MKRFSPIRIFTVQKLLPVVVGLCFVGITVVFYNYSLRLDEKEVQLETSRKMDFLTEQISQVLNERLLSFERMANRLEYSHHPDEAAWLADAGVLRRHIKGLYSLRVVDRKNKTQWSSEDENFLDISIKDPAKWSEIILEARYSQSAQMQNWIQDGKNVFVIVHPLRTDGKWVGSLSIMASPEALLGNSLNVQGYELEVRNNAKVILSTLNRNADYTAKWKFDRKLQTPSGDYWLKLVPTPLTLKGNRSQLPAAILIVGLIISALFGMIVHLAYNLRLRSKLVESQKRFLDTVIDSLPVAVYCKDYDDDLKFSIWNKKSEELFKISKEQAIGKTDFDIFSSQQAKDLRGKDLESIISGDEKINTFEENIVTSQGSDLIVKLTKVPITNEKFEIIHMLGIAEDITERKKSEAALQDSESKFSSFMENTPAMTWIRNRNGEILYSNSKFNEIFKYEGKVIKEMYGVPNSIPADVLERGVQSDLQALEEKRIVSNTQILADSAGKQHHWLIFKFPMHLASGQTYLGAMAFEITERVEAEKALEETMKTLKVLIDASPVPIMTLDLQGNVKVWSPACEKVFGWSSAEVVGKPLPFVPEHKRRESKMIIDNIMFHGTVGFQAETKRVRKDGTEIDIHLDGMALNDENNKPMGLIAILTDVSERVLAQKKLMEASAQAENAARLKSEFLANVSHEIRTPLNGIIGMTDLLLDSDLNEEQRKYTHIVQNSGTILLNLINDILDLSKVEAGKMQLENHPFSLASLVEGHADLLMAKAREKNLSLMTYIDPNLPLQVSGDPSRLAQILVNLMGNAIKFTHEGGISVRATFDTGSHAAEGNLKVRFEVHDTGIGLSEENKSKLFQPFSQAESSTTRKYGGTGLGLSISKRLVEAMNGEIGVDSDPGKGSVFWFTAELKNDSKLPLIPWPKRKQVQDLNILVVDDDLIAQQVVHSYLFSWGLKVDPSPSYGEVMDHLKVKRAGGFSYDMILIGQGHENLGLKLAQQISAEFKEHTPKLVLMPPFEGRLSPTELYHYGFSASLSKPFKQSGFFDCIVRTMSDSLMAHDVTPVKNDVKPYVQTPEGKSQYRILVADDISTNQILALKLLQNLGYAAHAVANGREVIEALELSHFDLVLMDCQMPEMDGFEAARQIRLSNDPKVANVVMIALTANAMSGDKQKCLEAGMNDYLAKPIKKDKLSEMLDKWLVKVSKSA